MENDEARERFERIETRLIDHDGRFEKIDARFDKVDERFAQVDARFAQVDQRFAQVDARFDKIERLIIEEGQRTRKYFDAVAEGLGHRIALIGEGYEALRADVTELKVGQTRLEAGQAQLDVRMLALESQVAGLDSRVASVEKTQTVVLTEVRGLATKVDRLSPARQSRRRG